jgi:tRNA (guanine37-N1)-methyltransferase
MVIRVDVVAAALEAVYGVPAGRVREERRVCVLTPRGRPLTDAVARELAAEPEVALLCGRYEGFDERVHEHLADDAISIGPFVLAGGEVAAMAVVDAVGRRLPGALGNAESLDRESFSEALGGGTEHPHYTRPAEFRGWGVPDVLLSGHHGEVERWRLARDGTAAVRRHADAGGGLGAPGALVSAIDHVALTVADPERSLAFYERALGMRRIEAGPGRVAVGWPGGRINLHRADGAIEPRAAAPTPGSADVCLRTALPVEAVLARLREASVAIEEGPVARAGAEGPITSVYVRDPDGNLIEVGAPAPADGPGA